MTLPTFRKPLRIFFGFLCYSLLLYANVWESSSTSGFMVFGLGTVLLVDRYTFRLLPWRPLQSWCYELLVRASYLALGMGGFALALPQQLTVEEIGFLGIAVMLAAFVLECAVGACTRVGRLWLGWSPSPRPLWQGTLRIGLAFGILTVLALPLISLHLPRTSPLHDPAWLGLSYETVQFPTADGLELGGWLVPHDDSRGSVIFCHGHGRNRGHVLSFLATLHDMGLNVLAFDFRGHGESPGHTETFGQREVQDVLAAERYLTRRFPHQPILVVGISYGAAVTMQALPRLSHVQAVWSEGCFSRLAPVVENQLRWVPAGLRRRLVSVYNTLAWLDCGLLGRDISPIAQLKQTRVPICFCHGSADSLIPFSQAQALYDAYRGPKAHYWIEQGEHDDLRQRTGAEYMKRLRRFFDDVLSRPQLAMK
jgi:alpha-beta hydrolase superfamily lysophospholipase